MSKVAYDKQATALISGTEAAAHFLGTRSAGARLTVGSRPVKNARTRATWGVVTGHVPDRLIRDWRQTYPVRLCESEPRRPGRLFRATRRNAACRAVCGRWGWTNIVG